MSWPNKIQLHDSQHSHTYNGSEVRETWYVEPFDSATAFESAMLGQVPLQNGVPDNPNFRILPAAHYLYPWCYATACQVVPWDPRSFSYRGTANLSGRAKNTADIVSAVSTYNKGAAINGFTQTLVPTADIDKAVISQANSRYSAGAFITVTYLPLIRTVGGWNPVVDEPLAGNIMDGCNFRLESKSRDHQINAGLKMVIPGADLLGTLINPLLPAGVFYPAAGIAPVYREEYFELTVERRMLPASFNFGLLNGYLLNVNRRDESFPQGGIVGDMKYTFQSGQLKFARYSPPEYIEVPVVDVNGEAAGYNRWANVTLTYDWRVLISPNVRGPTGYLYDSPSPVTWNHVLGYPGVFASLLNAFNGGTELGWYYTLFGKGAIGVESLPYPYVSSTNPPGANPPGGNPGDNPSILDPIYKFF